MSMLKEDRSALGPLLLCLGKAKTDFPAELLEAREAKRETEARVRRKRSSPTELRDDHPSSVFLVRVGG